VNEAAKTRLAPLAKERWDEDVRSALHAAFPAAAARFLSDGPDALPVPNVLTTLMHHPAIAGPFVAYNRVLLETPALGHRPRELMILRVAWRTQATYEWAQHTRIAADLGVTPDELDAIGRDPDAGSWTPFEADLLVATDQLIDRFRIEDETWTRLAEQLDERQLVEVVFVVGTYTCLAMAFNSFGLQLDPGLEPVVPLPPSA
jgi:alkylhydroperoxidase family enzyme